MTTLSCRHRRPSRRTHERAGERLASVQQCPAAAIHPLYLGDADARSARLSTRDDATLQLPDGDLWVFGYGSLMWNPGFRHQQLQSARIHGYHRALCVWSWVHRGSRAAPGLVLGLDLGGSCIGRAFLVREADKSEAVDYLYERELITWVYRPALRRVELADGTHSFALTFLVDRASPQYAGKLTPEKAARVVHAARGRGGPNVDYVMSTVEHLDELGIEDRMLHRVAAIMRRRP